MNMKGYAQDVIDCASGQRLDFRYRRRNGRDECMNSKECPFQVPPGWLERISNRRNGIRNDYKYCIRWDMMEGDMG